MAVYLHDGVGGEDLLLDLCLRVAAPHSRKVPHGVLRRHGLARTRLTTHDDRLVLALPETKNIYRKIQLNLVKTNSI